MTKVTASRRAAFLAELTAHGIVARAARAASPGTRTGAVQTFRDLRASDANFADEWDAAIETAHAAIESEIRRRAVEGYEEPIYGGRYKEYVVGSVRKYSDRLLELLARSKLPEYRERSHVELDARVQAKRLPSFDLHAGLAQLNREQRGLLRALLQSSIAPEPRTVDAVTVLGPARDRTTGVLDAFHPPEHYDAAKPQGT